MNEILSQHLKNSRLSAFCGSSAVQEVMSMDAGASRRLLKALVDTSIEPPNDFILARLIAARLVQVEFNHRKATITEGLVQDTPIGPKQLKGREASSLLPFNVRDYQEALNWATAKVDEFRPLVAEDEDGEPVKRGRKGGTFEKVKEYMLDNPETFEKSNKADEVAKKIAELLDVPETTTLQYVYKCRRLRKQEEI